MTNITTTCFLSRHKLKCFPQFLYIFTKADEDPRTPSPCVQNPLSCTFPTDTMSPRGAGLGFCERSVTRREPLSCRRASTFCVWTSSNWTPRNSEPNAGWECRWEETCYTVYLQQGATDTRWVEGSHLDVCFCYSYFILFVCRLTCFSRINVVFLQVTGSPPASR